MPDPTKPRPKYDKRIEQRHGSLLDSLVSIMGHAPDSVKAEKTWGARGVTNRGTVRVSNPDDQDALLHELGHFWSLSEPRTSFEFSDSTRFDPMTKSGNERLADTYATLLRTRNDTTMTNDKDAKLLYRILGRLKNEQREE